MNGLIGFVRPMSTRNFGLNSKTQTVANPIKQFSTAYAVPREAWGSARLDTIQDFLCELGMKPHIYQVKIMIFHNIFVIVRPTKIMQKAIMDKIGHIFKSQSFVNKSWSPRPIFIKEKYSADF